MSRGWPLRVFASMPARWAYWAVAFAATAGFTVCLGPALFGEQHWNLGGLGGFLGAAIGSRLRNRDYWQLDRTGRHEVDQAVRPASPRARTCWTPSHATVWLRPSAAAPRGNTLAIAVSAAALLAAPVLALARTQDRLYLLNLVAPVMWP